MEKVLNKIETELLTYLEKNSGKTTEELSKHMGIHPSRIGYTIRMLRKKHEDEYDIPYVYTSPDGYTLEEKVSNMAYETKRRLNMGTSIIMNGAYVYKKLKQKSLKGFQQIFVEYRPKMLQLQQTIKGG